MDRDRTDRTVADLGVLESLPEAFVWVLLKRLHALSRDAIRFSLFWVYGAGCDRPVIARNPNLSSVQTLPQDAPQPKDQKTQCVLKIQRINPPTPPGAFASKNAARLYSWVYVYILQIETSMINLIFAISLNRIESKQMPQKGIPGTLCWKIRGMPFFFVGKRCVNGGRRRLHFVLILYIPGCAMRLG